MIANIVAKAVQNSYWTSPYSNFTYGIRLVHLFPATNIDFPYQIIVSTYQPSVSYLADTMQQPGNIDITGGLNYYEWTGRLNNDGSQISWYTAQGPVIWNRVDLPMRYPNDQYTAKAVFQTDKNFNQWFWNKYNNAYPYTPGTEGL